LLYFISVTGMRIVGRLRPRKDENNTC